MYNLPKNSPRKKIPVTIAVGRNEREEFQIAGVECLPFVIHRKINTDTGERIGTLWSLTHYFSGYSIASGSYRKVKFLAERLKDVNIFHLPTIIMFNRREERTKEGSLALEKANLAWLEE